MSITAPSGLGRMCGCCTTGQFTILACGHQFSGLVRPGDLDVLSTSRYLERTWYEQRFTGGGSGKEERENVTTWNRYTNADSTSHGAWYEVDFFALPPSDIYDVEYTYTDFLADLKALLDDTPIGTVATLNTGFISNDGISYPSHCFITYYETDGSITLATDSVDIQNHDNFGLTAFAFVVTTTDPHIACACITNEFSSASVLVGMKSRRPVGVWGELVDGYYCENYRSSDADGSGETTEETSQMEPYGKLVDFEPVNSWNGRQVTTVTAGECNPAP